MRNDDRIEIRRLAPEKPAKPILYCCPKPFPAKVFKMRPATPRPASQAWIIAAGKDGLPTAEQTADLASRRADDPDLMPHHILLEREVSDYLDARLKEVIPGHRPAKKRRGRRSAPKVPVKTVIVPASRFADRLPINLLEACDLTPEAIAKRLDRAVKTLQVVPDGERRFMRGYKAAWPSLPSGPADDQRPGDLREMAERRLSGFRPTPADLSDYLTCLEWIRGASAKEDYRLLRLRAAGFSYEQMATLLKRPRSSLHKDVASINRRAWHAAIQQTLEAGNGAARGDRHRWSLAGAEPLPGSTGPAHHADQPAGGRAAAHASLLAAARSLGF